MSVKARSSRLLFTSVICVLLFLLWEALSYVAPLIGVPSFAFPRFYEVMISLRNVEPLDVLVTLLRVLTSLLVSFFFGTGLALLAYLAPTAERVVRPVLRIITAVPVISWILLAILWFRSTEFRVGFVLVLVCAPVFYVTVIDGLRTIPREFTDLLRTYSPAKTAACRFLLLPAALPSMFTAWRLALSLAIRVVTVAELVGAVTGVGHRLAIAQELFSISDILAWTIVLVIALFCLEHVLSRVEERVLNWREPSETSVHKGAQQNAPARRVSLKSVKQRSH